MRVRHVFVCSGCGQSIYEGERYIDTGYEQYHLDCAPSGAYKPLTAEYCRE